MGQYYKYIIAAAIALIVLAIPNAESSINAACILSILLFGIPHGAIDHKIHLALSDNKSVSRFIIRYVAIAIGYLTWWFFMPMKALLLFIVLSAYHFGQELIEDTSIKTKLPLTYLLWGAVILINPMLMNLREINSYIKIISNGSLPAIDPSLITITTVAIFTLTLLDLIRLFVKGLISKISALNLILFSIYITVSYLILPFLVAFTLYFVVFHSFNAFKHQFNWFKGLKADYSIKVFIKDLSLLSIIAMVGITMAIFVLDPSNWTAAFSYVFVFISLLTLPHSMVFDQLYANKRSSSTKVVTN